MLCGTSDFWEMRIRKPARRSVPRLVGLCQLQHASTISLFCKSGLQLMLDGGLTIRLSTRLSMSTLLVEGQEFWNTNHALEDVATRELLGGVTLTDEDEPCFPG